MSIVLLVGARGDADAIMPWRVRLRDRVATRVRAFGLDGALAQGVAPESSPALELRATTLIGPAAWQLGDHLRQILLGQWRRSASDPCGADLASPDSRRRA